MEQVLGKWLCELIWGFFLVPNQILVKFQIILDVKATFLSDVLLIREEMFISRTCETKLR